MSSGNAMLDGILWGGRRWPSSNITYYFAHQNEFSGFDTNAPQFWHDETNVWRKVTSPADGNDAMKLFCDISEPFETDDPGRWFWLAETS